MSVRFLGLLAVSALVHALLVAVVAFPGPPTDWHEPLILTLRRGEFSVERAPPSAASSLRPQQSPQTIVSLVEPIPAPTPLPPVPDPERAVEPVLEQLSVKPRENEETPKLPARPTVPVETPPRLTVEGPQRAELIPAPRPVSDAPVQVPDAARPRTNPAPSMTTSSSPSAPSAPREQGVKTETRLVGMPKPVYPREAQLRGWEGQVIVRLEISAEGEVLKATLHESSGYDVLDQSALRFAETLEFVPARRGKIAVATQVLLPVRYRIRSSFTSR